MLFFVCAFLIFFFLGSFVAVSTLSKKGSVFFFLLNFALFRFVFSSLLWDWLSRKDCVSFVFVIFLFVLTVCCGFGFLEKGIFVTFR